MADQIPSKFSANLGKGEGATAARAPSEKQQLSLGVFLVLVILGLIIVFVIQPNWTDITTTKSEIQTYHDQLKNLKDKNEALDEAEVNFAQIEDDLEIIDEAVPNYSDVPYVLRVMEKLASEIVAEGGALLINKITIAAMSNDLPDPDQKEALERNDLSLSLGMMGSYQAVRDYIVKLRSLRHNFFLEKITFSAPKEDSQYLDVNLSLKYSYFGNN